MPLIERRKKTSRPYPKRKVRGFPFIRLGGGVILCLVLGKLFLGQAPQPVAPIRNAAVIPDIDLCRVQGQKVLHHVLEEEEKSIVHVVKSGESLYGIFSLHNIDSKVTALILQSFRQLDLKTLFPGDSIIIRIKADSTFSSIDLFNCLQRKYTVDNKDSCLLAKSENLPVTVYTYVLNGSVETSLSEAMYTLNVGDIITAAIADIFAWDINFFIDPRKGDFFQVIFEKKVVNGRCCGYGTVIAAKYNLIGQKSYNAFGMPDSDGWINYYDSDGKAVQKQFLKAPLRYSRVSSGFSYRRRHPILGIVRPHLGVDYAAPAGTPVHAAADGKIVFAGKKGDYGNMVIVAHGGAYKTFYGHLKSFFRNIRSGTYVKQGDVVGTVGATGLATGPHLDYRMQRGGSFVNPMKIVSPSLRGISDGQQEEFSALKEKCRYIFEKRFSAQPGCFLIDITPPAPVEPKKYILRNVCGTGLGRG